MKYETTNFYNKAIKDHPFSMVFAFPCLLILVNPMLAALVFSWNFSVLIAMNNKE